MYAAVDVGDLVAADCKPRSIRCQTPDQRERVLRVSRRFWCRLARRRSSRSIKPHRTRRRALRLLEQGRESFSFHRLS